MNTRKQFIREGFGLAAIIAAQTAPAILVKSMLAARHGIGVSATKGGGYVAGYTNIIEGWSPSGSSGKTISLASPIVPLADFTIDGCMTYKGTFSGDSAILGLNGPLSVNFSLWFRNGDVRPRCFASEASAIASDLENYPTFAFSIRFDSVNLTMQFASGDLVNTYTFSTADWAWNTAYGTISSGLSSFGMSENRLSDINSLRVYPMILSDEQLLTNNDVDKARFNLT